jgi:hypothetical protein
MTDRSALWESTLMSLVDRYLDGELSHASFSRTTFGESATRRALRHVSVSDGAQSLRARMVVPLCRT